MQSFTGVPLDPLQLVDGGQDTHPGSSSIIVASGIQLVHTHGGVQLCIASMLVQQQLGTAQGIEVIHRPAPAGLGPPRS